MKLNNKRIQQLIIGSAYLIAFVYVFKVINPFIFFFTQQPAFLVDVSFFTFYLDHPGGPGQYLSLLLVQLFKIPLAGSIIMVSITGLTTMLMVNIIKKIYGTVQNPVFYGLMPLIVSLLMWHNVKYPFFINIQLLVSAAFIWLATNTIKLNKPVSAIIVALLAFVLYYISGAPYLYIFCLSIAIIYLRVNDKTSKLWSLYPLALGFIVPLLFFKVLTPISYYHTWFQYTAKTPLFLVYKPNNILYALLLLFPTLLIIKQISGDYLKSFSKIKPWIISLATFIILIAFTVKAVEKVDNKQERTLAEMQYAVFNSDWKKVLKLSKTLEEYHRMGNFFANQAMFHTGQFDTHFFSTPQLLGKDGLFIDLPLTAKVCMPSSYLYTQMGLLNNALRFAYEAQTLLPNSPYVLMQIIDCLIMTDQVNEASYFITQLNKNLLFRDFVKTRKEYIQGKDVGINRDFVHKIQKLKPKTDFYTSNPLKNVYLLSKDYPENKMAFYYTLTYYMLDHKLNNFANHLSTIDNLDKIMLPKIFQEAVLMHLVTSKNPVEAMRNVRIDKQVKKRFSTFSQLVKKGKKQAKPILSKSFADTYWYYMLYESPKITGLELKKRAVKTY